MGKTKGFDNIITIGEEISILRLSLSFTQEDFAKLMLISRVSMNKLEKAIQLQDISDVMLFRLYYLTQEIIKNPTITSFVKIRARKLNEKLTASIQQRIGCFAQKK